MNDEMTVIYIEAVGQIVAFVTRTGSAELSVTDVVGDEYQYRETPDDPTLLIPADELAIATVEFDPVLATDPRRYRYADGDILEIRGVFNAASPFNQGNFTVDVAAGQSPDSLTPPLEAPPDVWVLFRGGASAEPTISSAVLALDQVASTEVYPRVGPGDYDLLVAATGYRVTTDIVTVP